ncbi:MAG TPA: hypothetical protein VGN97_07730 [Mesorhizobium sp.]|nr:hypothetical protein [Mesorhizobium sp.]
MPEKHLRRYTSITSVIDALSRKELALLDPHLWDDRNDVYFMELYKEHRKLGGLYGMCCTQAPETYHHWRVFTGGSHGACIKLKREPFLASLAGDERIRASEVRYVRLNDLDGLGPDDRERLPFLKRFGYGPEREFRVIAAFAEPQEKIRTVPLDVSHIAAVYLNPWISSTVFESVAGLLRSIPGCGGVRFARSSLIDNRCWRRAGDRIVGKAGSDAAGEPDQAEP